MSEYSEETIKAIRAAYEAGLANDTLKWIADEIKLCPECNQILKPQGEPLGSIFGIPVHVDDSLPKNSFEIRQPSNQGQGRILKVHKPRWVKRIIVKNVGTSEN